MIENTLSIAQTQAKLQMVAARTLPRSLKLRSRIA
jgi:hypothetical protein